MDTSAILRICRAFRGSLRSLQFQAGLSRVLLVALVLIPPVMLLDWWVHLDSVWRLVTLVLWLAALAATSYFTLVLPLKRVWTDREVLRYLDAATGGMLLDLLELTEAKGIQELEQKEGRKLADAALSELSGLPAKVRMAEVFVRKRVMRWMGISGAAAVVFAVLAVASGDYFSIGVKRFFNPFSKERWPHRTTVAVKNVPEDGMSVPQMEPFTVQAEVTGLVPPQVTLSYRSKSTGYLIKEKLNVGAEGKVSYTFPEVREPLEFSILGNDYTTESYNIGVVERPYIKKITAQYKYPPYAGLPDKTAEGGQFMGLEGTKIQLVLDVSIPLEKALFVPNGGKPEPITKTGEKTYSHEIMLKDGDTGYAIELYDPHGYREPKPERFEIRVTPDHPPEVEIVSPGQDIIGTKTVGFDVAFRARDDFGLQKVEFLYSIDDGPPQPLTGRITGPITQTGRVSEARFNWDLRSMEKLPESGNVSYFARVQDINPTGRGKTETSKFQVKLLKPTDFHLETFEASKGILAEGLIAWRSQLEAWKQAQQWLKSGTGKEDDAIWTAMQEKQDAAIRAAKAMEQNVQTLIKQYENNHMEQDFMATRISQFASLLKKVNDGELPAVATSLRNARPKTQADATEPKVKDTRKAALTESQAHQRMAIIMLDRIVRKVFDWRDLQTATITTSTILDRQEEVTGLTEKIAPKTIGKEFEDLVTEEQDKLVTLGKQQRALFDAETQLEQQLSQQMHKARLQKRENIRQPLEAAFNGLRGARINDSLKDASKRIEDNQPSAIIAKQKLAVQILRAVKGGLFIAGQKPDPEEAIKSDLAINEDPKFEDAEVAVKKDDKEKEATPDAAPESEVKEEDLMKVLPTGSDPLSTIISQTLEKQDEILSRSKYLAAKDSKQLMPRYFKLRTNLLKERQEIASGLLDRAVEEAGKAKAEAEKQILTDMKPHFQQTRVLIEERNWGEHSQQLQTDGIADLNDLLQFVAFRRKLEETVAENKRQGGKDAFQRQFLLRDQDLDIANDALKNVQESYLYTADAARQAKRLAKFSKPEQSMGEFEKKNREHGVARLKLASQRLNVSVEQSGKLSAEVQPSMKEAGVEVLKSTKLEPLAEGLASGGKADETATAIEEARKNIASALQSIRDQFEERVKQKEEALVVAQNTPVSQEDFEKSRSPDTLAAKIKANPNLPAYIKDKMLEVLKGDLPPKYKELLIGYYSSFAEEGRSQNP